MQSVSFQNQGLHQSMCKQFIERGQKVTITVYIILLFVSRTSFPLKKKSLLDSNSYSESLLKVETAAV